MEFRLLPRQNGPARPSFSRQMKHSDTPSELCPNAGIYGHFCVHDAEFLCFLSGNEWDLLWFSTKTGVSGPASILP